jgi:capsular exopolysaccharide synthesis family protein
MSYRVEKALEKSRRHRETLEMSDPFGTAGPCAADPGLWANARREEVSQATLSRNHIVAGLKNDPRANAFRVLRARILQKMAEEGWTSVGITSAVAGDGKTLTAANLAVSVALDMNHTVLLVDLDLRRPCLHKAFGVEPDRGLSDFLTGRCDLTDCVVTPGIDRLALLPQVTSLHNSSEVLSMRKTGALMRELKNLGRDQLVIYDMPPLLASDDALVILPHIDATVLVVQEGKSEESEIEAGLDLLKGRNWLGSVLTKAREGEAGFY